MPVIQLLGGLNQEDHKFKASLGYIAKPGKEGRKKGGREKKNRYKHKGKK
jgi:hypothetical protein